MAYTRTLWEKFVDGDFEVFVSPVFFLELNRCPNPKLAQMYGQLQRIGFIPLGESDEAAELAEEYIRGGVLPEGKRNDCLHIAYAVANDCDVVLSWNFDDIVCERTRNRVKLVNATSRYKEIGIVSPDVFLKGNYR